jgi:hypothetical protein
MKVKCDYCDNYIDETLEQCPYCGAPNEHMTRSGTGEPKTIAELLAFADAHGIPLERIRFFIGKDCHEPRCFGLYQDGEGNYVVYKNKSNGQRVIRYRGEDEAFAVNEIYQKMKAEVLEHKQAQVNRAQATSSRINNSDLKRMLTIFAVVAIVVFLCMSLLSRTNTNEGYYRYGTDYYYYDDGWYTSQGTGWYSTSTIPSTLSDDPDAYYQGDSYSDISNDADVSEYISRDDKDSSSNDSWWSDTWDDDDWDDNDWDSNWDSWDTGATDWDSDW